MCGIAGFISQVDTNDNQSNVKSMLRAIRHRGPDGSGTYTARCISCAERGGDSDSNHLRFHPEKGLHCFAGCFAPEIMGLIRMKTMEGSK